MPFILAIAASTPALSTEAISTKPLSPASSIVITVLVSF
jgi:hypothetical protein